MQKTTLLFKWIKFHLNSANTKQAHGAGGEENRPGNERITVVKACWLVDQCCRPLQLSPPLFSIGVLLLSFLLYNLWSSLFLLVFCTSSSLFLQVLCARKWKQRPKEMMSWCGWWCCCHYFSSSLVLLRLPFLLVLLLLLLMAAHSVVVSFTGGRKSSAGMANDRRPWSLGFLLLLYCHLASPLTSPSSS